MLLLEMTQLGVERRGAGLGHGTRTSKQAEREDGEDTSEHRGEPAAVRHRVHSQSFDSLEASYR